jgi:hypothetical protein
MWKIELKDLQLPPGFFLKEDEDFLYLFYEDVQVAVFSATGVDPKEIEKTADDYLKLVS